MDLKDIHVPFHMLGQKASLSRYKKTETTSYILSDPPEIGAGYQHSRNSRKFTDSWTLNNSLLNLKKWLIMKIKKKIKTPLVLSENENTAYSNL